MKKIYLLLAGISSTFYMSAQVVTKYAGIGDSATFIQSSMTIANTKFNGPRGMAVDKGGRAWIVESTGNRLRTLDNVHAPANAYGRAGSFFSASGSADNSAGANATFDLPTGIVADTNGNLYVTDFFNNCIRKVAAWVNITQPQAVSTFAGVKGAAGMGWTDGGPTIAQFNGPTDIAIDPATNTMYVADQGNNCIRKITPAGNVSTLAGAGPVAGGDADGTGANALMRNPTGLDWYSSTELVFADWGNSKIKKVNVNTGVVTTIAGIGAITSGTIDGDALTEASFSYPTDVAVDSYKNIYVTESESNVIRKITGSCVTTFAGSVGVAGNTNGTGSAARFKNPTGIFIYKDTLYVGDQSNHMIRKITVPGIPPSPPPVAYFNNKTTLGYPTTVFDFIDSTTQPVDSRVWSFNPATVTFVGGTDSTSKTAQVKFDAKGIYTVNLKVKNCWGTNTKTRASYVMIWNVGVNETSASQYVDVYPNPSQGLFTVAIDNAQYNGATVKVTDVAGKTLYEKVMSSSKETLDLGNFAKGIYIMTVSGNNLVHTQKLIIE